MLSAIELKHFKCFESLKLPLGKLTLLAGSNASGKSSVLQALVLLHQTMREYEWSTRLILNGRDLRLGTIADVLDKVHGRNAFEIGFLDDSISCRWTFSGERTEMSLIVDAIQIGNQVYKTPETLHYLVPAAADEATKNVARSLRRLTYLTAERVGPRDFYALEDRQTETVGSSGEYSASVLYWGQDQHVLEGLTLVEAPPTRLKQVQERMRLFFPGCALTLQPVPQVNAVTLGIRTTEDTDFHRPVHVGFGITQVFPIVVAALSAQRGDLLLIENPEVHLHPAGQAMMGEFLSQVANAGVQVIVETHSDHVLNGIRRAVKKKMLQSKDVTINYFRPRSDQYAQVVNPVMDASGGIDKWPSGFFDQFDRDTAYFAEWGE